MKSADDRIGGTRLGERFSDALAYASRLHRDQVRKANNIPYIAHLLAVTSLVLEAGGDEDQAIGALLHDAVEDQGGLKRLDEIRERYGARVADIVDGCSDSYTTPKPEWKTRKVAYLDHLPQASPDVLIVSLADKLHNARSIVRDLRAQGNQLWGRFNGGREGSLWYYRSLADTFSQLMTGSQLEEFVRTVDEMERLASTEGGEDPIG